MQQEVSISKWQLDDLIKNAFNEDGFAGDVTTLYTIEKNSQSIANITCKENGVICGMEVAKRVLTYADNQVKWLENSKDGDRVAIGHHVAHIDGSTRTLLIAERVMLNLIQRMSGIATMTRKFCDAVEGTGVKIVDTRKTIPGLRLLDKYAVVCGGGTNHRFNLSDGILVKDNHIKACGGIASAVHKVKRHAPHTLKIEVEVSDLEGLKQAIDAGADIVMLDNMELQHIKKAVEITNKRVILEASGMVSLENVRDIANTGVDLISVGKLTHSVKALDISMNII